MNQRFDEAREWLLKAEKDLLSARILMEYGRPVLETGCFHCQQAVEKALKCFLVWKSISFERVHSLTYLLDLCETQESGFAALRDKAETLAPYAVEVRYPGKDIQIPADEAREVLATTEAIWNFILDLLPDMILR